MTIDGRMTNKELAEYIGINDLSAEWQRRLISRIRPEQRKVFDRMLKLEHDIAEWQAGLAPKPTYALIDEARVKHVKRNRSRKDPAS